MGSYGTNGNLDAGKLVSNLSKISGYGGVTETAGTRFPMTVTVDGKSFTISATGAVEKSGPRPTVTSVTVTLENGDEVPEEKVEEGTVLKINLTANIEGGTITSISPSVPYTTNGTEKSKTFTITGSADGESYSIEYTVQLSEYYAEPDPEAGKTTKSKNRTLAGKTDTTLMTYKNPVIPQGFSAIDTADAKWEYTNETTLDEVKDWNKGLVITDGIDSEGNSTGNEFVWVPCTTQSVDSTSPIVQYSKNTTYPGLQTGLGDADDSDGSYSAIPVTENTQINTYGGFYVARYEAGLASAINDPSATTTHANDNSNTLPVSKYGSKVWNYISFNNSYVAAQKMINDSTTYGNNKSGLITGTQWDTIMKWLESANIGVLTSNQNWGTYRTLTYSYAGTQNNSYFTYGSSLGAWSNGAFSHTGSNNSISDSNKVYYHASGLNTSYKLANSDTPISGYPKNIADLGGNLWEWTSETYTSGSSSGRVSRGGNANGSATGYPASCRGSGRPANTGCAVGFRVVLYIQ